MKLSIIFIEIVIIYLKVSKIESLGLKLLKVSNSCLSLMKSILKIESLGLKLLKSSKSDLICLESL